MTQLRLFSDFDFNFQPHPSTGDLVIIRDERAIKNSVKHLVLTNFYGRPFHPEIGSAVAGLLFENDSAFTKLAIEHTVQEVIENYEGFRVSVTDVEANFRDTDHAYFIEIILEVEGMLAPIEIDFLLYRTR